MIQALHRMILCFFLAVVAAFAQNPPLPSMVVSSQRENGADHQWLRGWLQVKDIAPGTSFDLKDKKINYYFYAVNFNPGSVTTALWAPNPNPGISFSFVPVSPAYMGSDGKNANFIFQISFSQHIYVTPSQPFEFKFGFHTNPYRNFYEDDDYSYRECYNGFQQNPRIVLTTGGGTPIYWGAVPSALARIEIAPPSATVNVNDIATFFATGYDQNNTIIFPVPNLVWSVTGNGTINANSGLFTAGAAAGTATVKATSGSIFNTAIVTVIGGNTGPVITRAWADPSPVTGKTTLLNVDATGQGTLSYLWEITSTPPAPPASTPVISNPNAQNPTVTFTARGSYQFKVTVTDGGGGSPASENVSVTVNQTVTGIEVWPPVITTPASVPRKFISTARDQFGYRLSSQPTVTWSITAGAASIISTSLPSTVMIRSSPTANASATITAEYTSTIKGSATMTTATPSPTVAGTYLKNIFIIMQENRSFDNYFGTYPGANGFARIDFFPQHHHTDGGLETEYPHDHPNARAECSPDNFDESKTFLLPKAFQDQANIPNTDFNNDCFGYHNDEERDMFNYWRMADTFVLQDNLFESCKSYSQPSHCYMVSGWSADCRTTPWVTSIDGPPMVDNQYLWKSIASIFPSTVTNPDGSVIYNWKYHKCVKFDATCACDINCFVNGNALQQNFMWLPMNYFPDASGTPDVDVYELVHNLSDHPALVPKVCWMVPGIEMSDHPQGLDPRKGMKYVTSLVKAIMGSPLWNNCAIFVSWDDWGGHYDHVIPPYHVDDQEGWGLRVPGMMLSPYAKKASTVPGQKTGWVDHEQYSHDAYLKLIEDLFCGGQRIMETEQNKKRSVQREDLPELGNLLNEFDFSQDGRTITQPFIDNLKCLQY